MGERLARHDQRRSEVDVELQGDALRVLIAERASDSEPGGVDEHVHAPVALCMGGDDACALVDVAEIGRNGERSELLGRLLERLRTSRDQRQVVAVDP